MDYKDTALILPDFKKLDILAIKSETLRSLTMPDTLFKIVSPDNAPNEWLESSDDMSAEDTKDFEKKMKRTRQRIAIIHHTSNFALAGIVFLIWKS